jgi:hypothetical protein
MSEQADALDLVLEAPEFAAEEVGPQRQISRANPQIHHAAVQC